MGKLTEREVRMRSMLAECGSQFRQNERYYSDKGTQTGKVRAAANGLLAKRVETLLDETAGD